ncbi:sensor histidine kinase [Clostridium oceanicum]
MINKPKKLKHRFAIIFILFSFTIISLASILTYTYVNSNLNTYAKYNTQKRKDTLLKRISKTYKKEEWDKEKIEDIGVDSIDEGLIIKVKDKEGNNIWSARDNNNIICESVLKKIKQVTNKINPGLNGEYIIEKLNIKNEKKIIGTLEIEYLGPFYYSNSEVIFFKLLKEVLIVVCVVSLIFSIIIAVVISSSISKPILKVIKTINSIAKGNYSDKVSMKNNIDELNQMIESVNKMANNLEEQEKVRKVLTRDISHELRTPITTMQIQIEAIIDGLWEPTEERLKSIHHEMLRLNRLVVSLEKLSQYESNDVILKKEEIGIGKLIKSILVNFEKKLLDKNIILDLSIEDYKLLIDKDKISQVIINIFSNSIKYTPDHGKIIVRFFKKNDFIYISIKDNGIGIDKKDINQIFNRFYRTDKSRATSSGGIGIGLTISRTIVKSHGGNIEVKSEINKGSEFIISLPTR